MVFGLLDDVMIMYCTLLTVPTRHKIANTNKHNMIVTLIKNVL